MTAGPEVWPDPERHDQPEAFYGVEVGTERTAHKPQLEWHAARYLTRLEEE